MNELQVVDGLVSARVDEQQAKAFATAMSGYLRGNAATKADIAALHSEIRTWHGEVVVEIRTLSAEIRSERAKMESRLSERIRESEKYTARWLHVLIGIGTALLGSIGVLVQQIVTMRGR